MYVISIDGACRRNGKPDCVSAGGMFLMQLNENLEIERTELLSKFEIGSTNQRGELHALWMALDYLVSLKKSTQFTDEVLVVTDSEYLFNAMTKEWLYIWRYKDFRTSTGEPVKNLDLWQEIDRAYRESLNVGVDIDFYHIKGHCIPFGAVTAERLLSMDMTGKSLLDEVLLKYEQVKVAKYDNLQKANELSIKNNGFALDRTQLKLFVAANVVADAIATQCVNKADALM